MSSLWGSGPTYAVHLRLIGKPVVDFLFVLIELLSLAVTAEVLGATIYCKSAFLFLKEVGQFRPNFHIVADVTADHFCTDR